MTSTSVPHALIIGAGVAGCALALFLKRAGITASIYEAYPRAQACQGIGGGLQIAPNGMNVLAHLGLADRLESRGVVSRAFAFHNQHGRLLCHIPIEPNDEVGQPAVILTRATLHQVLLEAVEEEGINIEFSKRLVGLSGHDGEGEVKALFEDGSEARGDFVAGADGLHSRTRAIILGDRDPKPTFVGVMTSGGFVRTDAFVSLPESEQGTMHFLFGCTGGSFGYCRAKPDDPRLVMWWRNTNVQDLPEWEGRAPTKEELQAIDINELKHRILDVPGGWGPVARQFVADTDQILRGTIHDVATLPQWYQGRAVLLGDAAHAVSPHSGQGASMALEDSMYLAKMLRLAVRDHYNEAKQDDDERLPTSVLEAAFGEFQNGRKERAEMIVAEGRRRGEGKRKKGQKPPGAIKRKLTELLLTVIFRLFRSRFLSIMSYRIEWDDCASLADVKRKRMEGERRKLMKRVTTLAIVLGGLVVFVAVLFGRWN